MAVFVSAMVFPHSYSSVVPVNFRPVVPFIIVMVRPAYSCIRPPVIVIIWAVISVSGRVVVPAVRSGPYLAIPNNRSYKITMIRPIYIMSVIYIDIPCTIVVIPPIIIIYI
jgi:hypothetical protein